MKLLKISLAVLSFTFCLLSCKKDNDAIARTTANNSISTNETIIKGVWVGEYKISSRSGPAYLSFDIQPGGVLHLLDQAHANIGEGTWALDDSTFNAYYMITATQEARFVTGSLHAGLVKLDGIWQFDNSYEDAGTWFMDKM